MRAAARLLASVSRSTQYLEPGAPTGLTGIVTHSTPRSTLLYTYHSTLEKLKEFPEHSVYRQSTEALTRHRMSILESVKPAGLSEWQERVRSIVERHPQAFRKVALIGASTGTDQDFNIVWKENFAIAPVAKHDPNDSSVGAPFPEGPLDEREAASVARRLQRMKRDEENRRSVPDIEAEPPLTAEQINEIESKIGAGLIEEVIRVAEGEKELVETMLENKVWEDLEEKPQPGQWTYFERDTHTGKTQAP